MILGKCGIRFFFLRFSGIRFLSASLNPLVASQRRNVCLGVKEVGRLRSVMTKAPDWLTARARTSRGFIPSLVFFFMHAYKAGFTFFFVRSIVLAKRLSKSYISKIQGSRSLDCNRFFFLHFPPSRSLLHHCA